MDKSISGVTPTAMAMQGTSRNHFLRYPTHCDRCDADVSGGCGYTTTHRETVAGSFPYTLCQICFTRVNLKGCAGRDLAIRWTIVRRAARYSPAYRDFVAAWFGVRIPRDLLSQPTANPLPLLIGGGS